MIRSLLKTLGLAAALTLMSSLAYAGQTDCSQDFMKDPCAAHDYSVVETEKDIKAPHNCMAIAHYFPGEEPEGYCGGGRYSGKNTVRAQSPVAAVN